MPNRVDPSQTSFNAGELSPMWAGRVDMAKYGNGCNALANYVPIPEGPKRRRMGTRFGAFTKDEGERSWGMPFIYSEDDSYVVVFGDGNIRFLTGDGQLLLSGNPAAYNGATAYVIGDLVRQGGINYYCIKATTGNAPPNVTYWYALTGSIYEIPSPYSSGDLTNADGTFRLDFEQTGDVIFITHGGFLPYKLARFGNTRWTMTPASVTNGPFEDQLPTQATTIYASAATGNGITLTASAPAFTAAMVGTLFLLEQKRVDAYPVWEVGKAAVVNDERRSDSNVYKALNAATTGTVKPTHRDGVKLDGTTGVQWEYQHSGYGHVRITAIGGGGTTATADVVSRLPSSIVGAGNGTTKWAPASWRSDVGYPDLVRIHRERLCFHRGQENWGSVSGDLENFATRDGAETLPDSSYSIRIASGETNDGVWMVSAEDLIVGTRGGEFAIGAVTSTEPFGPGNLKATRVTKYGSRQVRPAQVGDSILMTQRSGKRVRDFHPSSNVQSGYEATSLMVLSGHMLRGQLIQMDFALEPHSIVWGVCRDGSVRALTYQLEQDVIGWHPHFLGGAGIAESVVVIPSPDGTHDRVWFQVYRTVNGNDRRYWEYLDRDWEASEHSIEDALYSDAGLTFTGGTVVGLATLNGITYQSGEVGTVTLGFVPVAGDIGDYLILTAASGQQAKIEILSATNPASCRFITSIPLDLQTLPAASVQWMRDTITGLDIYEGQEVTIWADGAEHPPRVVSAATITLQSPARIAQIGFRANAYGETMRIEAGSSTGTSQGKIKRCQRLVLRLHETLGGKIGPAGKEDDLNYRSAGDPSHASPPVFTGEFAQSYPEGFNTDGRIRWLWDTPAPSTICGVFPRMQVEDSR